MPATKILVTGAAGFVGFHVVQALINRGDEVVGIDNLNNYYDPALKRARLEQLRHPRFTFHKLDIADLPSLNKIFEQNDIDRVVHLAAQAGVRYSIDNPHSYLSGNLVGFGNILEVCRHNAIAHLIYASSSSVYGLNETMPFCADHPVDHPISLYAASKRANELMAHAYSHTFSLPTTGLRFFTVYGPWGRPDMAYFSFTKAILAGEPIRLFNHGKMRRDFTYIDDVITGLIKLLDQPATPNPSWSRSQPQPSSSNAPFRVYNVGNNSPIALSAFVAAIEKATGREAIKEYLPMQPGDVAATCADVQALEAAVEFAPNTPINTGIEHFVAWYQKYFPISNRTQGCYMKVVIIGAGYVGLVSGACFAEFGANVTCIDKDLHKIKRLKCGEIPIYEPGLNDLVQRNVAAGRLNFDHLFEQYIPETSLVFIAVGTPTRRGDGHADLQYVFAAAEELAQYLTGYTLIVDKSTVPIGTASEVKRIIC